MSIENHIQLIGNLGNDPDTKYTQGGMAVTKISLATTSRRTDKDGNKQESTQWHRVTFFGKLGEIAGEHLRKGSKISVQGSIRYDKYTDKEGVEKYSTDIIADQMMMLDAKPQDGQQSQRAPSRQQSAPPRKVPELGRPMDDFSDDDIPF